MSLSNVIDYNLYYCPIIKKNLYYCPCMISYSDDGQGLYFFFVFLENLFYWSIKCGEMKSDQCDYVNRHVIS